MCCARDASDETNPRVTSTRDTTVRTLIHTIPDTDTNAAGDRDYNVDPPSSKYLPFRSFTPAFALRSINFQRFVVGTIDRFAIGVVNSRHSRTPEHGRWNMRIAEKTTYIGTSLETDGQVQRR